MIEQIISRFFSDQGWTWKLKGGRVVTPSDSDVEAALEEAARQLHSEPVGTRLEVGRLIIEKRHIGYDVYMYVGNYI